MSPATIRKLIELVEESQIEALEVTSWWRKVKITRKHSQQNGSVSGAIGQFQPAEQQIVVSAPPVVAQAQHPAAAPAPVAAPAESDTGLVEITSPMVGTYYSAPSPESPEFVKVGDSVDVGTVVCIVEAMKLMNEIESEQRGKIAKILVENAQPVEFGQPLYLIDPS